MPCIMTLLALAAPRLVVAVLWFFTHWFRGVFDNMTFVNASVSQNSTRLA